MPPGKPGSTLLYEQHSYTPEQAASSDRYRDSQIRPIVHDAQDDPVAEWARRTGRAEPMTQGVPDTREGIAGLGRVAYVPADADQPYRADPTDYNPQRAGQHPGPDIAA